MSPKGNFKVILSPRFSNKYWNWHCVESIRIRRFSGQYFPAFGLNTEYLSVFSPYGVYLRIQSKCGKIRTRKTPNIDTFHAVNAISLWQGLIRKPGQRRIKNPIKYLRWSFFAKNNSRLSAIDCFVKTSILDISQSSLYASAEIAL